MKIKTKERLIDFLDEELSWRKKELSTLRANVERSREKFESTAIRSGIVLLYAHWEGFLKKAAEAYLEYVINRRLKYKELSISFIAISAKHKLNDFRQTDKATINTQVIEFLYNCDEEKALIPKENVIKTGFNLHSSNLREMVTTIGLDFSPFETKSKLIDEQLLKYRNNIAHGKFLQINSKDYVNLHNEVTNMIEVFKTDIENAVLLTRYLRT